MIASASSAQISHQSFFRRILSDIVNIGQTRFVSIVAAPRQGGYPESNFGRIAQPVPIDEMKRFSATLSLFCSVRASRPSCWRRRRSWRGRTRQSRMQPSRGSPSPRPARWQGPHPFPFPTATRTARPPRRRPHQPTRRRRRRDRPPTCRCPSGIQSNHHRQRFPRQSLKAKASIFLLLTATLAVRPPRHPSPCRAAPVRRPLWTSLRS